MPTSARAGACGKPRLRLCDHELLKRSLQFVRLPWETPFSPLTAVDGCGIILEDIKIIKKGVIRVQLDAKTLKELNITATKARLLILEGVHAAKAGHPGGSLSCVDALTALYFGEMQNLDPQNAHDPDRDRFVLSKGHCAPALYAVLCLKG